MNTAAVLDEVWETRPEPRDPLSLDDVPSRHKDPAAHVERSTDAPCVGPAVVDLDVSDGGPALLVERADGVTFHNARVAAPSDPSVPAPAPTEKVGCRPDE